MIDRDEIAKAASEPIRLDRRGLVIAGDTRPDDVLPDDVRRIVIASNWVIDSRWVTSHWVPALSRNVVMTCSFSLVPEI